MPTAIFDIDGTLTDTNQVDEECYVGALLSELGIEIGSDWDGVEDVTDAAILRAVWKSRRGGGLPHEVEQRVIRRFLELLGAEATLRPHRFHPVPGAKDVFSLVRDLGWSPAIATGGWRDSAQLKLNAADIRYDGVPFSTSSERVSRTDILRQVLPEPDGAGGDPIVYFGDGVWDFRAAETLGIRFVGIGVGPSAQKLRDAGVTVVLPDFIDVALVESALGI